MKKFKIFVLLFSFALLFPINGNGQDHTAWSYNLSIYEVNVRQYTKEGTFTSFNNHLDRLKDLGVGIIWFMPIHPIGVKNRLGSLGSYYSVKDYYGINSEFGTLEDFKATVDSIHKKGMYVVIDWVANHTSWDNGLTVSHPEWYAKNSSGNFIPPPGTNWSDVIQLDYTKQELRNYMIDVMKYWITETKIDGFRCDAASFVPIDFWTEAITALKNLKPEIIMIAEDNASKYYPAGFDVTYAWSYYGFGNGILVRLFNGTNNADSFNSYVLNENSLFAGNKNRMYFTSNHDENSWYGTDTELFGSAAETFIALSMVFRGIPLIYGGQEAGLNHRLKFFDKDEIVWQSNLLAERYTSLLHLKRANKALWNGVNGGDLERVVTTDDQKVFAFLRKKDSATIFAVFNLSNLERTFTLSGSSFAGSYRDAVHNTSLYLHPDYTMTLPAWGYDIFENGNNSVGVAKEISLPYSFFLDQNYPNPFNPSTTIHYGLPASSHVSINIYNNLGQEVANLVNSEQQAGSYETHWNTTSASGMPSKGGYASGVYFYRINAVSTSDPNKRFMQWKKMLLLK
ncbi:MAG: alpha-amylase family glycosyl hydrolase [Bacteroidota bacterium]|nr:alpha-amylase family glycosyl hydrolase [Bacteroidota bacterium]